MNRCKRYERYIATLRNLKECADELKAKLKDIELVTAEYQKIQLEWMVEDDAMKLLGLNREEMASYRAQGTIPYQRVGGIYFYDTDIVCRLYRLPKEVR